MYTVVIILFSAKATSTKATDVSETTKIDQSRQPVLIISKTSNCIKQEISQIRHEHKAKSPFFKDSTSSTGYVGPGFQKCQAPAAPSDLTWNCKCSFLNICPLVPQQVTKVITLTGLALSCNVLYLQLNSNKKVQNYFLSLEIKVWFEISFSLTLIIKSPSDQCK